MNRFHYIAVPFISLILLPFPQTLLSQEARHAESSGWEWLVVVASVRGKTHSVDFDPVTGVAAVDMGEGNVVFVDPGEDTTFDMGAGDVVRVEVPDSGGGVLLNVVSGDIEVQTPTGDVINMDAGDGVQVSETEVGGTAVSVTATGGDGGVTVETGAGTLEMDVGDAVEVGEAGTDGGVEVTVTVTSGEVTLAIDVGDVTMDVGDAVAVTEGMDGVGLEIISGEVTLETGTGDVVMDAGDAVIISVDSESGNAEIGVVGGDGVDVVDADTGETVTMEVGGGVVVQIVVDEGDNEGQTDYGANVMGDAEAEGEVGVIDEGVVFTTNFDESDTTASYVSDISESSNTYTEPDSDGVGNNGDEYPNDPTEDRDDDGGSGDDDGHDDNGIHRGNDKEDRHKDKGKHKSEGKKKRDFAGLTDNIVDPPDASMNYLLTFAKMIRGDMDTHNEEYPDDAASQSDHQTFIEEVGEVISDININPDTVSEADIFDSLRTARDSLKVHEDTKGHAQHVGIAHHLLDSKIFTDGGVEISLNSIEEEMDQAKVFLNEHINDFGDTTAHNDIRFQIDSVNNNNYTASTIDSIRSEIKKAFRDTTDHMHGSGSTNKYRSQEMTRRVSGSKRQPYKLANRKGGAHGILHTTNPGRKVINQSKHTKKH
ncbi:MAG: hypothetical protein ACUZ8I_04420 [Candidatus Scalindua sp.]